jgi:AraC-like DNA-binding protein
MFEEALGTPSVGSGRVEDFATVSLPLSRVRPFGHHDSMVRFREAVRAGEAPPRLRLSLPGSGTVDYAALGDVFVVISRGVVCEQHFTVEEEGVVRFVLGAASEEGRGWSRTAEHLDLSLLQPVDEGVSWRLHSAEGTAAILVFADFVELAERLSAPIRQGLGALLSPGATREACLVPLVVTPTLHAVARRILELEPQMPTYRLCLEGLVLQLLAAAFEVLFEGQRTASPQLGPEEIHRLHGVRARLNVDHAPPPTLEKLARDFGTNRRRLTEDFKALFGTTIAEYAMDRRMTRAAAMLRDGHPVADVAYAVGYRDQGSFTRAFKRCFDTTPRAYQRNTQSR